MSSSIFHPLEQAQNLRDGYLQAFKAGGRDLILVQQGGEPSVLEGICPHAGHPFADSRIIGSDLRCDMHGYLFNVHTGACTLQTEGPCRGLRVYPYAIRNGVLGVILETDS